MNDSSADRNPVELLAEDFLDRQRRGEKPTMREYCERNPALADEIRLVFPALCMVEDLKPEAGQVTGEFRRQAAAKLERIGDYRLIREVGRGGMGIVYEAEQESLGRHVALKVLPSSALLDQRQLARFQREAKAAARLHHTNIVPVYGVGEHDSTHYYVMQFIQGLGLDEVLEELRRLREGKSTASVEASARRAPAGRTADASQVAHGLMTGDFRSQIGQADSAPEPAATDRESGSNGELNESDGAASRSRPDSSSSIHLPGQSGTSSLSETGRQYWHSVARIGIQVADALAYANSQGTLHRDIKPSNLLLDTQGTVWVTDFGLAKAIIDQDNLTHTGDIVGTLRYMAPERFHGQGDARSDIYSLGLTLYEMLTQRPAFDERQREKLVQQVMHDEPPRPRKLNKTIPRDLETIVLKAIAREPRQRYATPTALADDLKRFIEDKPIQARRVTVRERFVRWCRRNPALAASLGLAATALVAVATVSFVFAQSQAENSANLAKANQDLGEVNQDLVTEQEKTAQALKDSRRQLVRLSVEQATRRMDDHDHFNALLLATRALELDAGDSQREAIHRKRIAAILQQCPRPVQVWNYADVSHAEFSPDGKQVLIVSADRRLKQGEPWQPTRKAQVWDVATKKPITPPLTHGDYVYFAKYNQDGRRVVTVARVARKNDAGEDQPPAAELLVWDLATQKPVGPPIQIASFVNWGGFHPAGELLMLVADVAGDKKEARQEVGLWEIRTGKKRHALEIEVPDPPVGAPQGVFAYFDPTGQRLITLGTSVQLWDVTTRQLLRTLEAKAASNDAKSRKGVFSPDGRLVLAYGFGARLYRVDTGARVGQELTHGMWLTDAAFSPDGKLIVTTSYDHTARIWDVATTMPVGSPLFHDGHAVRVVFSADGRRIVTSSYGGAAWIWNIAGDIQVETRLPHAGLVERAEFSPDSRHVLTYGRDGAVKVWDLATETIGRLLADRGRSVQFNPDGRLLAVHSRHGLHLRDGDTGQRGQVLAKSGRSSAPRRTEVLAFSPDGKRLAAPQGDALAIDVWDVDRKIVLQKIETIGQAVFLAFSPDGRRLIANCEIPALDRKGWSCELGVWDLTNPQPNQLVRIANNAVRRLAVSKDGRQVVLDRELSARDKPAGHARSAEPDSALYDLTSGEVVGTLPSAGYRYAFSPDGESVAVVGLNYTVKVFAAKSGALRWEHGQGGWVISVEYNHNGQRLLTGSFDGSARIWNAHTGVPLVLMTHRGSVSAAHYSSDSRLVLTVSGDKTARVWEAATGHPVTPPMVHPDGLTQAAGFNADATRLFTVATMLGENENSIWFWALRGQERPLPELSELARALAARELSPEGLLLPHAVAAETWRALMSRWPDDFRASPEQEYAWHLREALACTVARRPAFACVHWRRITELQPDNVFLQFKLVVALAESGQFQPAIAALKKGIERDPAQWPNGPTNLAVLHVANRDPAAYRQLCAKLFEQLKDTVALSEMNQLCWPMCFAPDAHPELRGLADKAIRILTKAPAPRWALNTAGCFLYRAGRDDDALKYLHSSIKADPAGEGYPEDWVFLALVHHRQNRPEEARQWLDKAKTYFADAIQGKVQAPTTGPLWRIELDCLIREAEATLGAAPKK